MRIFISKWVRFLIRSKIKEIALNGSGISISTRDGNRTIPLNAIDGIELKKGLLWSSLTFKISNSDSSVSVRGMGKKNASEFVNAWWTLKHASKIFAASQSFDHLFHSDAYFTHRLFHDWMIANAHIEQYVAYLAYDSLPVDLSEAIRSLQRVFSVGHELVKERNSHYVESILQRYEDWFDRVEKYPLTRRQREAIAIDENNCLVVAGAGTGKTSVVIGKVGFLLKRGLARPEEILLLAFTNKAKQEIEERIKLKFNVPLKARTFHGLGLEIMGSAEGKKPSLSLLSEDDEALAKALQRYLNEMFADPISSLRMVTYFANYLKPYSPETDFTSQHDYIQYLKSHDIRSIKGEKVKSYEEGLIANWLFLNSIDYTYEMNYRFDTATPDFRQYKPDFYLPEKDIYLEHFGIGRNGGTAPWVDNEAYLEGMEWKRCIHDQFGTTLIETYSYQYREGTLFPELEAKLRKARVEIKPRPSKEIIEELQKSGDISLFVKLLQAFLSHFKGNQLSFDDLRARAKKRPDRERLLAFSEIFETIFSMYERELRASGTIDFNDMIGKATGHVQEGRFVSPFKYVIVDEFQDISQGRYRLIKALLDQVPDRRLLCVGDDWQSIYRFAGSDMSIMTGFEDHFGFTERVALDKTFRFNRELLDFSTEFILKNPMQIRKSLDARVAIKEPAIRVITARSGESGEAGLREALNSIQERGNGHGGDVLLIGRYRHNNPDWSSLRASYPTLNLNFMTAHSSKGREADYAIVLDVISGKYGFPSEIVDDPILNLVLSNDSAFLNAEERRLFYVAVTRAKNIAFLITHETKKSSFIEEIEGPEYEHFVSSDKMSCGAIRCSKCGGGFLIKRKAGSRSFWGCSNYPYCDAISEVCFTCKEGVMIKNNRAFICSRTACGETAPICPRCGQGMLIVKDGKYGPFLGCTNWRSKGASCKYTQKLSK